MFLVLGGTQVKDLQIQLELVGGQAPDPKAAGVGPALGGGANCWELPLCVQVERHGLRDQAAPAGLFLCCWHRHRGPQRGLRGLYFQPPVPQSRAVMPYPSLTCRGSGSAQDSAGAIWTLTSLGFEVV